MADLFCKSFFLTSLICSLVFGSAGESAVITLIFPFGARSCGMGEVGTALADDEAVLYWNPAGLAVSNPKFKGVSIGTSMEPLLPALGLRELWHHSVSVNYQPPNHMWGGFGLYINTINMGENTITDHLGREKTKCKSWEQVMALGWGFNFAEFGDTSHNFGIALKPFYSALAPGYGDNGEGTAFSFAIDAGYLKLFRNGLRLGFTLMNMGPDVSYFDHAYRDPIPFTTNLALGFKKRFPQDNVDAFKVACELRLSKELVINEHNGNSNPFWKSMFTDWFNEPFYYEMQEININVGYELCFMNTGLIRQGFLFDYLGERYEMHLGIGLRLLNHLGFDFGLIISPEGYMKDILQKINKEKDGATGIRNGQWQLSFTINGFSKWSPSDRYWWLIKE